jgi:hypothetical protein
MAEKVAMIKRFVKVWDGEDPCEITVVQKSKSVSIAVGTYIGMEVQVEGRTANNAIAKWRDTAHYRNNRTRLECPRR